MRASRQRCSVAPRNAHDGHVVRHENVSCAPPLYVRWSIRPPPRASTLDTVAFVIEFFVTGALDTRDTVALVIVLPGSLAIGR